MQKRTSGKNAEPAASVKVTLSNACIAEGPIREPKATWPPACSFNCYCITHYNEKCSELRATLEALIVSDAHFASNSVGQEELSNTICVIADGAEQLDPDIFSLMESIGSERCEGCDYWDDVHAYVGCSTPEEFLKLMGAPIEKQDRERKARLTIIFFVKKHNVGKLHSHEMFFGTICELASPRYCYQIDTGTLVSRHAVAVMVDVFERNSLLAAVAPQVMPAIPELKCDFLVEWQYFDFAFSRGVSWPLEVASGHLSVLPGQVSAFRWNALVERLQHGPYQTPVHAYLRGLATVSALERVMFLAEDRVLGTELILGKTDWRLEYAPQSRATTDHCQTFDELFRQRRRWINSSLACRIWLLGRMPTLLARRDRPLSRKATLCTASVIQTLLGLRDLFSPAIFFAMLLVLVPHLVGASTTECLALSWTFLASSALDLVFANLAGSSLRPKARASMRAFRSISAYAASAAYLALIVTLPRSQAIVLLTPAVTVLPMMCLLPPRSWLSLVRMQFSPLTGWAMLASTCAYALFNLNDVSWGTKGLLRSKVDAHIHWKLKRVRALVFAAWMGMNFGLAYLAIISGWPFTSSLNIVVQSVAGVDFLLAAGAVWGLVRGASKSQQVHRTSSRRSNEWMPNAAEESMK